MKHFAGDVVYAVEGFIAKNSDKLLPDLENAMLTSKSPFIKKIFEDAAQMLLTGKARTMSGGGMGKQPTTIGFKFKNQVRWDGLGATLLYILLNDILTRLASLAAHTSPSLHSSPDSTATFSPRRRTTFAASSPTTTNPRTTSTPRW